jgi:uncharacterized protein
MSGTTELWFSSRSEPLLRVLALLLGLFVLVFLAPPVLADPTYPALNGQRVVDAANLLSPQQKADLTKKLADLETKTSAQLVIATVPDLQGYAVEEFGVGLLRFWALGQKDKNNGALILVAKAERKIRIEVGYGLEGALTDAATKLIITNAMIPPLRTGDYATAFSRAVDDIGAVVSGEAKDQGWKGASPRDAPPTADEATDWAGILFPLLMVLIFLWIQFSARRRFGGGGFPGVIVLPRSGGWSSGGGGGGFSGGGFSGGGGSGGGGGASGDF